jgi:hypothetical protein
MIPGFYGEWMATNCLNHSRTYEKDINCTYTSKKTVWDPYQSYNQKISHCFVPYGNYKINAKLPIKMWKTTAVLSTDIYTSCKENLETRLKKIYIIPFDTLKLL